MMQAIPDLQAAMQKVAMFRNQGANTSNFYLDEERMAAWCRDGAFSLEQKGNTLFLVRRQRHFANVYFLSRSADALGKDWKAFAAENGKGRWILDLLGPDPIRAPLEEAFFDAGFTRLTVLQRMGRQTPADTLYPESGVEYAHPEDTFLIQALLEEYFDAETEQLPSVDEIYGWIKNGTVLVEKEKHSLLGFAIFDLRPATLHLRYWFVLPSVRGLGKGGRLLKSVLAAGAKTRRQYLWVKTDNENAIDRYRHYGFQFEAMKDVVMGCST